MSLEQLLVSNLPGKHRNSSGGWRSFDCPCCIEEGEPRRDTKMRGGLKFEGDVISYHCFNCGFTASHVKGRILSQKFVRFMRLYGIPDTDIRKLQIDSIREKELSNVPSLYIAATAKLRIPDFSEKELPKDCRSLDEWLATAEPPEAAIMSAKYLIDRGVYDHVHAYWSPDKVFRKRVIFPYFQGSRTVGYAARSILPNTEQKFLQSVNNGFLYNIDKILEDTKYLIVVEGVIDAASLGAVGVLTNEAGDAQIDYINMFKGEVIVCPDRDKPGEKLIKQAIANGWSVSFPDWESGIKDAADAVGRYGKLYALRSIIDGKISNSTKISVKMRLQK